jgi:hypothetical protein
MVFITSSCRDCGKRVKIVLHLMNTSGCLLDFLCLFAKKKLSDN